MSRFRSVAMILLLSLGPKGVLFTCFLEFWGYFKILEIVFAKLLILLYGKIQFLCQNSFVALIHLFILSSYHTIIAYLIIYSSPSFYHLCSLISSSGKLIHSDAGHLLGRHFPCFRLGPPCRRAVGAGPAWLGYLGHLYPSIPCQDAWPRMSG